MITPRRPRSIFWRNIKRLVTALGIIHAQGLVHGAITAESVMTEGAEEPDFQLTGFEWSCSRSTNRTGRKRVWARRAKRAVPSATLFAEGWRALGQLAAHCLDVVVRSSGEVLSAGCSEPPVILSTSERVLLKRLVSPTRLDNLDLDFIGRAVDDILADVGRANASRSGTYVLMFAQGSGLGQAVYDASEGDIPVDEYSARSPNGIRADLDSGATLLMPRRFDAERDRIHNRRRVRTIRC